MWFLFELGTERFTGKLSADGQECRPHPGSYVILRSIAECIGYKRILIPGMQLQELSTSTAALSVE